MTRKELDIMKEALSKGMKYDTLLNEVHKIGYTVNQIDDRTFELVKDDTVLNPGTYLNPIEWYAGMTIYAGVDDYEKDGWYVYDGLPQRCIKTGSPISFTDTEFWEVI